MRREGAGRREERPGRAGHDRSVDRSLAPAQAKLIAGLPTLVFIAVKSTCLLRRCIISGMNDVTRILDRIQRTHGLQVLTRSSPALGTICWPSCEVPPGT